MKANIICTKSLSEREETPFLEIIKSRKVELPSLVQMSHRLVSGFDLDHDLINGSLAGSSKDGDEEEDDGLLCSVSAVDLDAPVSQYLVGVGEDSGAEAPCFLGASVGAGVGGGGSSDGGPSHKRFRGARVETEDDSDQLLVKDLLRSIHQGIMGRLNSLEKKVDAVSQHCLGLEQKVDAVETQLRLNRQACAGGATCKRTIISAPPKAIVNGKVSEPYFSNGVSRMVVTLNAEEDFPNGTWLGDSNCPHRRVRCHISPSDLKSIEDGSPTPEKMALTLLDFLFDRETQACSNISGQGKQGKKQLDPLFVFGIRCHLQYKFGTGDKEWQRIKTNLDSKCRTAHRRKVRGMPLLVKAFKDKVPSTLLPTARDLAPTLMPQDELDSHAGNSQEGVIVLDEQHQVDPTEGNDVAGFCEPGFVLDYHDHIDPEAVLLRDSVTLDPSSVLVRHGPEVGLLQDAPDDDPCSVLVRHNDHDPLAAEGDGNGGDVILTGEDASDEPIEPSHLDLGMDVFTEVGFDQQQAKVLRTLQGDIRVLHATPEQLAEIQRSGRIQILTREDFLDGMTLAGAQGHSFSIPPEFKVELGDVELDSDDGSVTARHVIDFP